MAMNSATTMDIQTPSIFQRRGRSRTAATWKTMVRRKEIMADVRPSPNAVKNPEP